MSKPRIGMVGLGGIAQKVYLPILTRAENWSFVGAYSPNKEKRSLICSAYRIGSFDSLSELAGCCDAVFVHSSTDSHYDVVSTLLAMGKDVYVDKPLAATLEQAEQLAELSTKLGRKLMIGFNRRFAPLYVQAKQKMSDTAWVRIEKHRSGAIGPQDAAFTMLDDYLHVVDTARWLAKGSLTSATGTVRTNEQNQLLHTQHHFDTYEGFTVSTAMHRHAGTGLEQLEIVQAGEIIRVQNMNVLEVERAERIEKTLPPSWQTILSQRGFEDAVRHFMDCLLYDQVPTVDAEEALKSQQLLMSMLE
ncbi:Gfo/Idh/MocA family protein [Paenibacillus sp. 2TAB23]|uniref:Gfo/Idh/MocA family protein n=1 Tax=Paenibacillus sp. 2TAB23 TaxID=3233004 RepID=UPI003F97FDA1